MKVSLQIKEVALIMFLTWLAAPITPSFGAENSWTKTTSGYWEEPFWSAGHLPSIADNAILVTNAGWKALAIGPTTTTLYPGSVSNLPPLIVDAPVDSRNLLLLNYAGLSVPLHPNSLGIGTNGSLISYYSAIDATYFALSGQATFAEFGQSRFGTVEMGGAGPAELILSNGWFSVGGLLMGKGSSSTFNQWGGSNQVSGTVSIDTEGSYNLFGGNFKAQNIDLFPLREGSAPHLNIAGGTAEVEQYLTLGGSLGGNGGSGQLPGLLTLSDGLVKGGTLYVARGQVNQSGGSMTTTEIDMLTSTAFNMTNGVLDTSILEIGAIGGTGIAEFKNYGGSIRVRDVLTLGLANPFTHGMVGNFLLVGGRLEAATNDINTGRFTQTGGTNLTQALNVPRGDGTDQAEYFLLGGFLGTGQLELGNFSFFGLGGTLVQSNGVHANSDIIRLWAIDRTMAHTVKGRYRLAGGLFTSPHIHVIGGEFTQNGGSNQTENLDITDDGRYYIDGGFLTASNVGVSTSDIRGFYSSYYHQGGTTTVPGTFSVGRAGSFTIQLGTFTAPNISVGVGQTTFQDRGRPIFAMQGSGTIVNNNFTLSGGNLSARSQHQLGKLDLSTGVSALSFEESGAVLRFLDSHTAAWSGTLLIQNWAGSMNGGGANQLYFGNSAQGLTAAQLNQISFTNPAGLPSGNYPARILATGEVVPASTTRPSITYTRSPNELVLSWPAGYQLYSSTNVAAPFTLVPNATSPYPVSFNEPQRYFQVRSPAP